MIRNNEQTLDIRDRSQEIESGPLVLISNQLTKYESAWWDKSHNQTPVLDYIEISRRIGGDILGQGSYRFPFSRQIARLEKRFKIDFIEAFLATKNLTENGLILSTSEKSAIPVSLLLTLRGKKTRHIVIGHHLSSINKSILFKFLPLHKNFSHVICLCRAQSDYAVDKLRIPESSVDFIYAGVDQEFFSPEHNNNGDYLLTVGREQRDYNTLLEAVRGTGLKLAIVASSAWSTFPLKLSENPNVRIFRDISFPDLRSLYAGAALVVIPLHQVDYAAGVNSILEGMAMEKPVIATRTTGILDYIQDGETGKFVSPANPEELRDTILSLLGSPKERDRLGTNAHQAVMEKMTLDRYIRKIVKIAMREMPSGAGHTP